MSNYICTQATNAVTKDGSPIAGSPFADNNACIQGAVDDASAYDTINILAGTWDVWTTWADFDIQFYSSTVSYATARTGVPSWDPTSPGAELGVVVDKTLFFKGEKDGAGVPTTLFSQSGYTTPGYDEGTTFRLWAFWVHGPSHCTFEDMKVKETYGTLIDGYSPINGTNVRGESCVAILNNQFDERYTADSGRLIELRNCHIVNAVNGLPIYGSDVLIDNFAVGAQTEDWWLNGPLGMFTPLATHQFNKFAFGEPDAPYTASINCKNVTIQNSTCDISSSTKNVWEGYRGFGASPSQGSNVTIQNCSWKGPFYSDVPIIHFANFGAENRDTAVIGNTFEDMSNGYSSGAFFGTNDDCFVNGNIFTSVHNNTNANSAYTPTVQFLTNAQSANHVVSENNYINSGMPSLKAAGVGANESCVLLSGSYRALVKESGNFPVGQGGTANHVSDFGISSRIIGEPASEVEKPAGIKQYLLGLGLDGATNPNITDYLHGKLAEVAAAYIAQNNL